MMMAMTYSDDYYNCGISDDGGNHFGDGNDDGDDFNNDCNDGGDDPLFIMVMTMVMGMITMMVGKTLVIWW